MQTTQLAPRIGMLCSGILYAYQHGFDKPETVGTLEEVERAMGAFQEQAASRKAAALKTFDLVMNFAHPSWDEADGLISPGINAACKSVANKYARRQAERVGRTGSGKGRYSFTATEAE